MISCRRGPPAPCAITMRSMGLPARRASATGWMPLSNAIALRPGLDVEPVIEAIGEVRHGDHQRDLDHLFMGKMLEHLFARGGCLRGAGQLASIMDGGSLGRVEAFLLPVLEGAQFVFGEPGFAPSGEIGGDTECTLVGVG